MRRSERLAPAGVGLPERVASRRGFDSASKTFDAACAAHDYARDVLLRRLEWFDLEPGIVLDAGSGTARADAALERRYPRARLVGVDRSAGMIAVASRRGARLDLVHGDVESLPFASQSIDVVFANLVLPWCDPARALGEFARVLAPNGLLLLSSTGPATLEQVRRAWRAVDDRVHVHGSIDIQTLGDLVAGAGLREPVLDTDRVTLSYSSATTLHRELKALGASNVAGGRRRSLTGKQRFAAYESCLRAHAGEAVEVSVEFHFVQAWGRAAASTGEAATQNFRGIAIRRE